MNTRYEFSATDNSRNNLYCVDQVSKNTIIDCGFREGARAKLRVIVKRVLKKYGYPPDEQEYATDTVLQQAETLSDLWAA